MDDRQVQIIPADSNWRCIYDVDGELYVGDALIAWRIETEVKRSKSDELTSAVFGVSLTGNVEDASNFFGYLRADGSVEVPFCRNYESLAEAQADIALKKKTA